MYKKFVILSSSLVAAHNFDGGKEEFSGNMSGDYSGDLKPEKPNKPKWDWKRKFNLDLESVSNTEVVFSVVGRRDNFVTVKGTDFIDTMAMGGHESQDYGSGEKEDYELDFGTFQLGKGKRGLQFKYNGTETMEVVVDYFGFDGNATCTFDMKKDVFFDWTYECKEFNSHGGDFCVSDQGQIDIAKKEDVSSFDDENASFSNAVSFKRFGIRSVKTCNCGYEIKSFTGNQNKAKGSCMYDPDYYTFYWKFWRDNKCVPSKKGCETERPCFENNCSHNCMEENNEAKCTCPAGMTLGDDNETCESIDDLEDICSGNMCSHFCVAEVNGYTCTCPKGFYLGNDDQTCESTDSLVPENTVSKEDFDVEQNMAVIDASGNSNIFPAGRSDLCFWKKYSGTKLDQAVSMETCSQKNNFKAQFDYDSATGLILFRGSDQVQYCVGVARPNSNAKRIVTLKECYVDGTPNPAAQWNFGVDGNIQLRNNQDMCLFWKEGEVLRVGKCFNYSFGRHSVIEKNE